MFGLEMLLATPRLSARLWSKVAESDDCWLWTGARDLDGYGMFQIGVGRAERAHRVAYQLRVGPIAKGLKVLHHCDNPPCVRPDHLFLGTDADNMRDRDVKGRQARGERHGRARLTRDQVAEIRVRAAAGATQRGLAREFGVAVSTIHAIVHGRHWQEMAHGA